MRSAEKQADKRGKHADDATGKPRPQFQKMPA
jgi:hypothetical protein